MERNRETVSTAINSVGVVRVSSIGNNWVVIFIWIALVQNRIGMLWLKHDRVPSFSRSATKQSKEGIVEALEVDVIAHLRGSF